MFPEVFDRSNWYTSGGLVSSEAGVSAVKADLNILSLCFIFEFLIGILLGISVTWLALYS